jgi:hypothetical protein
VRPEVLHIADLTPIDCVIFERACRVAIEQGHSDLISGEQLILDLGKQGISEAQIMETQDVLERRHYVEMYRVVGPPHAFDFAITIMGFDQFARTGIPDYRKLCADVARCLVREEHMDNKSVAEALNQPIRIIDHVFESLESNGLIKYGKSIGGGYAHIDVFWVSPELRRKLEAND